MSSTTTAARSIKGSMRTLKTELLMPGCCLPANGITAQAQLKIIDRELERVRQASPAFANWLQSQWFDHKVLPIKLLIGPSFESRSTQLHSKASTNKTNQWPIQVAAASPHSLTNFTARGQLMDKQIASSPQDCCDTARRPLRHRSLAVVSPIQTRSAQLLVPITSFGRGSVAPLEICKSSPNEAPAHRQGTEDDEEGLDWRQKRALRLKKKKAAQRALLHGDDDEAAEAPGTKLGPNPKSPFCNAFADGLNGRVPRWSHRQFCRSCSP